MKVLHVISGISPLSGGPTRSVKGLCRALSKKGIDVSLCVLRGVDSFENNCSVKVVYNRAPDVRQFNLVHIHGLWDPLLHDVARKCRNDGVKYMISPRGMLDPWALSVKRWKKRLAMAIYQRRDLACATAFHATADAEANNIRSQGLEQPIIISPNGIDCPAVNQICRLEDGYNGKTALFLSRLHPGKGLLTLAEAWARLKPHGWRMMVVGPDSYSHKIDVMARLELLGIANEWIFAGPVDDESKWIYYNSADLLVHPSVSENFGITIAEGLAAELPVICTKGTPWSVVEERKCGWWIDVGVEPLANALHEAMTLSDADRQAMGSCGRKLVEEKYTWDAVVMAMVKGYEEVLNGRA